MAFRFFTIIIIFGCLYGLLGFNLYRLQVLKSDYYVSKAEARTEALKQLELRRGQIFFTDRNGNLIPVAQNRDYPVIYAVPKEIKAPSETAKALAPLIDANEAKLAVDLDNPQSLFKLLVDRATDVQIQQIKDLNLDGIYFGTKQSRSYPFGDLAANLVGFVGVNSENDTPVGLYGLEKYYNDTLAEGNDVQLTIDRNLEAEAEQILSDLVQKFQAVNGTVIIQEPKTGKILALANVPDFDPNEYSKYPVKDFLNQAVQLVYEPGSVFKPLTMAAGIDSGAITSSTTYIDKGKLTLNGKTITNWDHKAYGKATMTNVIEHSINTGAVFAEQQTGNKVFHDYLVNFGFGTKSDIDLPDEVGGSLKNLEKKDWRAIDFANAAFGQGTAVTPVQLITAFSAIANGGLLMKPYVNVSDKPYVVRRVVSDSTAGEVTQMMESAVNLAGVATISEYNVAGKTGTAQIPDFVHGGYLADEYIHSYVGFAPATDAKFVILIKVEKPNVTLAAQTVVPAFQQLGQYVLNYYNVPPDKIPQPQGL